MTLIGPNGEVTLHARVDASTPYNWVPAAVLELLGVLPTHEQRLSLGDGKEKTYRMAFVLTRLEGDERLSAWVFADRGTQTVLAAATVEAFGLQADPLSELLVPVTARLK